jgi:CheY-like chemotaxis protein
VLVVEDEALVRLLLSESLKDAGYQVVEAGTGDEAARLIDGPDGFDLVISDIQMPGALDGIEVGIHARRRHASIPIIYVTGRPESMNRLGSLGPHDAFVPKPYGPRDVITLIDQMLS